VFRFGPSFGTAWPDTHVTFDNLPGLGIHGNSHMFMQDRNNVQIADLILAWIDGHVEGGHKK